MIDTVASPEQQSLDQCIQTLRATLTLQMRLLDAVIHALHSGTISDSSGDTSVTLPPKTKSILPLMIQSAGSSCHTILRLTSEADLPVRDCFPIARAIVETIINISYILAKGEESAQRMENHALQKSYRDMNRSSSIGELSITLEYIGRPAPSDVPGLQEAIREFSTKKGEERRTWTKENIETRLAEISARFGEGVARALHVAHFAIYRHSSEILHGTFFGCMYFFGATQPGFDHSRERARATISNHMMLILFNLVMAVEALVSAVHAITPISRLAKSSKEIADRVLEIPMFKAKMGQASANSPP